MIAEIVDLDRYPLDAALVEECRAELRREGAVKLERMDVITMGRTQLAFVPFCGEEFDWSELAELEE